MKHWYGPAFDGLNFKKLERALDFQQKGYLECGEFCDLMEKAIVKGTSSDPRAATKGRTKGGPRSVAVNPNAKKVTRDSFVFEEDKIKPEEVI